MARLQLCAAASLEHEENGRGMKITCQACQAKYTIADEKVVGKIVKIRCKKCGATIVVNGNEPLAGSSSPPEGGGAFDYAGQGTALVPWTVNVADGDQRTMTEPEIAVAYRAGVVNGETFCWTEGMADWLPIQEIAGLYAACSPTGRAREEDELATKIQDPGMGPVGAGAAPPPRASIRPKDGNGTPAGPPPTATIAARRAGGRAAAADLFGGAAHAGGEDEVMTSAPASVPQHADGQKVTGARNDNSLLFGLSEKGGAPPPPTMTATTEASGLIDIRQLGAQMRASSDEKSKKTRVDDIMNLGGGAFSPSLAAPVLSAPSLEHYSQPPPGMLSGAAAVQVKNRALGFLAFGAGVFFLVAAGGIVWMLVRGKGLPMAEDRERTPISASAAAVTPTQGASAATGTTPSAAANAATQAPAAPAPTEATGAPPPSEAATAPPLTAGASKEAPTKEMAPMAPKEPKAAPPTSPREVPAAAAPSLAEFNMGETKARLAAIAGGVQTCKRGDTTGSGKVEIVFGPSGAVQSATLIAGSPFDGTPTGRCVEARFRQAHVPAFGGAPFPVTKSFTIN
jgi:predicted Zn finger-like uncharacterized protein